MTTDTLWDNTAIQYSGIRLNSPAAASLNVRSNVLDMTRQAEKAVLQPDDAGAWPHALRAALAARVASQHDMPALASHFLALMSDQRYAAIADPVNNGQTLELSHVVAFMDAVSVQPKEVVAADISVLQQQGVSDADIVRLTELNAFLAYQLRLIAGLALLNEVPA